MNVGITHEGWVLLILVGVSVGFIAKWLLQPIKNSYFNQANIYHKQLRHLLNHPDEHRSTTLKIIQLCQLAIQQKPNDGDAHIMLASSYAMLAFGSSDAATYHYCMSQAIATIKTWRYGTMHTRDHHNGNKVHQGIIDHIRGLPSTVAEAITENSTQWYTIAVDPERFKELKDQVESEILLIKALNFVEQGHNLKAIELYTEVINQWPDTDRAFYGRSMALLNIDNYESALDDVDKAIELNPHPTSYVGRALVHLQIGNYEEAFLDANQAIKLRPDFVQAYMQRGMVLFHLGRKREAYLDFDYYLTHTPKDELNESFTQFIQSLIITEKISEQGQELLKPLQELKDKGLLTQDMYTETVKHVLTQLTTKE